MITENIEYVEELVKYNFVNNCEFAKNVTLDLCLQKSFGCEISRKLIKKEIDMIDSLVVSMSEKDVSSYAYKKEFIASSEYLEKIENLQKEDYEFLLLICGNWQLSPDEITSKNVICKLREMGIFKGKNSGMYFQIWDERNFSYYIAGQCVETFIEYGFIPFFIQRLIFEWFKLYGDEKSLLGKYIIENDFGF